MLQLTAFISVLTCLVLALFAVSMYRSKGVRVVKSDLEMLCDRLTEQGIPCTFSLYDNEPCLKGKTTSLDGYTIRKVGDFYTLVFTGKIVSIYPISTCSQDQVVNLLQRHK